MNIMETWLDGTITENAEMEGYKLYRGDKREENVEVRQSTFMID